MKKTNRLPREEADGGDGLPATSFPEGSGPTDQDVEGHVTPTGEGFTQRIPGTGGDFRRPSGGGELTDDVEGHLQQRLPGTGGDFRRPSGGGEATDDSEGDSIS